MNEEFEFDPQTLAPAEILANVLKCSNVRDAYRSATKIAARDSNHPTPVEWTDDMVERATRCPNVVRNS